MGRTGLRRQDSGTPMVREPDSPSLHSQDSFRDTFSRSLPRDALTLTSRAGGGSCA